MDTGKQGAEETAADLAHNQGHDMVRNRCMVYRVVTMLVGAGRQ